MASARLSKSFASTRFRMVPAPRISRSRSGAVSPGPRSDPRNTLRVITVTSVAHEEPDSSGFVIDIGRDDSRAFPGRTLLEAGSGFWPAAGPAAVMDVRTRAIAAVA